MARHLPTHDLRRPKSCLLLAQAFQNEGGFAEGAGDDDGMEAGELIAGEVVIGDAATDAGNERDERRSLSVTANPYLREPCFGQRAAEIEEFFNWRCPEVHGELPRMSVASRGWVAEEVHTTCRSRDTRSNPGVVASERPLEPCAQGAPIGFS